MAVRRQRPGENAVQLARTVGASRIVSVDTQTTSCRSMYILPFAAPCRRVGNWLDVLRRECDTSCGVFSAKGCTLSLERIPEPSLPVGRDPRSNQSPDAEVTSSMRVRRIDVALTRLRARRRSRNLGQRPCVLVAAVVTAKPSSTSLLGATRMTRTTRMVLFGLLALVATAAVPRAADAVAFDCFATTIGCGNAWIKTCNCTPPF